MTTVRWWIERHHAGVWAAIGLALAICAIVTIHTLADTDADHPQRDHPVVYVDEDGDVLKQAS